MSNFIRDLEEKIKPWMIIVVFLVLLIMGLTKEARADTSLSIGPVFASGKFAQGGAVALTESFGKYEASLGYISEQTIVPRSGRVYETRPNAFLQLVRNVQVSNKFTLGIGVAGFNGTNRALGSHANFALHVRYRFSPRVSCEVRHWSNAGSATPNMGQDAITCSYYLGQ